MFYHGCEGHNCDYMKLPSECAIEEEEPSQIPRFWMIYGLGKTFPLRWPTRALAQEEAEKLALDNPGKDFFILKATTLVTSDVMVFSLQLLR